jgi:hypothetical protein
VLRQREILVDLARDGGERHRHVHTTNLVRIRPWLGLRLRWRRLCRRRLPAACTGHVRVALGEEACAESRPGRGERYDC